MVMSEHHRPFAFVLAAATLAAITTGCGDTAAPVSPTPVAPQFRATRPLLKGPQLFGATDLPVGAELGAVRAATAAFHSPDAAAAAGYQFGEPCIASPAGAMGSHTLNPPLVAAAGVEAERPEALLYFPQPDGGLKLAGVEYIEFVRLRNPATGEVAPWFSSAKWPSTYEVVSPTPELFGRTFDGPMPGHTSSMPWHWDLHVWLWTNNPAGLFAQWNPALQCQ
jgi:hypothetical protein